MPEPPHLQLEAVIRSAFDAIVAIDQYDTVVLWNPMAENLFGWSAAEAMGRPLSELIIPERLRQAHVDGLRRYLRTGEQRILDQRLEVTARHCDGREFPVELTVSAVGGADDRLFTAFIHDISVRRAAEQRLKRDYEWQSAIGEVLRLALEPMPLARQMERILDVVLAQPWLEVEAKGCLFVWDEEVARLRLTAHRNLPEALLRECAEVPSGRCLCGRAAAERTIVFASEVDGRHTTEFPGMSPHGHYCIPIVSGNGLLGVLTVYVQAGTGYDEEQAEFLATVAATAAGLIERKRAEERLLASNRALEEANRRLEETQRQLIQSEKMASIGQLAAGVAHEINNPVGYIHSNLGTLDRYVGDLVALLNEYQALEPRLAAVAPAEAQALSERKLDLDVDYLLGDIGDLIRESREGTERVRQIVRDLKDFSHVGEAQWQTVDLHRGLDSTLNVVWNELKYKADVVKEYGDLPPVPCLPQQLNQVFMNLLVNAAQAIDGRGTITLRSGYEGAWGWIEVADTGKGIAAEHIGRIFDPFFTTKAVGKGTGLGLSLSYGIVQNHGGRIEVASEPGRGTRFRVWLPLAPGRQAAAD